MARRPPPEHLTRGAAQDPRWEQPLRVPEDSPRGTSPSPPDVQLLAVTGHEADDVLQLVAQPVLPTGRVSVQSGEDLGEKRSLGPPGPAHAPSHSAGPSVFSSLREAHRLSWIPAPSKDSSLLSTAGAQPVPSAPRAHCPHCPFPVPPDPHCPMQPLHDLVARLKELRCGDGIFLRWQSPSPLLSDP